MSEEKYIRKLAKIRSIIPKPNETFEFAIVIPAYCELDYIDQTIKSIEVTLENSSIKTAIIIVVNNPQTAPQEVRNNNSQLLLHLRKHKGYGKFLFLIDATSIGNEITGGVGMARKIGMDSTLNILENNGVIISLDADTSVEPNYLQAIYNWKELKKNEVAASISFRHKNAINNDSILDYELYMQQYKLGLSIANSPYNYFSIASALVCRKEAYIKAGGMRVRTAGEDFYFLQIVRNLGKIGHITSTQVHPSDRFSERVDFGTGKRINEHCNGKIIKGYNPEVFKLLKEIFNIVNDNLETPEQITVKLERNLPQVANQFFINNSFEKQWDKILKNTPNKEEKIHSAFHTWFNAFKTLKFIHHLEDNSIEYSKHDIIESIQELTSKFKFPISNENYSNKLKLINTLEALTEEIIDSNL